MSDNEYTETAQRNGLVWHRRAPAHNEFEKLRHWLQHNEKVRQTFDDDARAILHGLRTEVSELLQVAHLPECWKKVKLDSQPGSDVWALANVALQIEVALRFDTPEEKLRAAWNAALELGKTLGGLALGENYTMGKKYALVIQAQKNAAKKKPDTTAVVSEIESLLKRHPQRTPTWAAKQISARELHGKSSSEINRYADAIRKRYVYQTKKAGDQ